MYLTLRHTLSLADQDVNVSTRMGKFVLEVAEERLNPGFSRGGKIKLFASVQEDVPHVITTDFSEYPIGGGTPYDWTKRWDTADATYDIVNARTITDCSYLRPTGPNALHVTPSTTDRVALSFDRVGTAKDFDIRGTFAVPDPTGISTYPFYFHVRGQGSTGSETAYRIVIPVGNSSTYQARISKYVSGTSTDLDTVQFQIVDDFAYYFRIQCIGSSLKAKIWSTVNLEPREWLLEAVDSDITTAGWVGVGQSDTDDYYFDWISVGLNGAEPERPDKLNLGNTRLGGINPMSGDTLYLHNTVTACCAYLETEHSRKLYQIGVWIGAYNNSDLRVALYKGGLPEDPSGATLVEDLGILTVGTANSWHYVTASGTHWLSNGDLLWIVVKNNDTSSVSTLGEDDIQHKGNFHSRAYYTSSTIASDETTAYPATWPSDSGSWTTTHVPNFGIHFDPLVKEFSPTIAATSSTSAPAHTGFTGAIFNTTVSTSTSTSTPLLDNLVSGTTDFSEYTTSAAPSDWTEYWDTANVATTVIEHASSEVLGEIGTKCLYWEGSTASRRALLWDDSQGFYNGGALVKVKLRSDATDDDQWFRLHLRSGGSTGTENSIHACLDDTSFYIASYVGGTSNTLVTETFSDSGSSEEFWIRLEVEGLTARAKIWNHNHPEPYDWTISTSIPSDDDPGSGYAGIGSYGNADFDVDYFAFYGGSAEPAEFPLTSYYEDLYFGTTQEVFSSQASMSAACRMHGGYLTRSRNLTGIRIYKTGTGTGSVRLAVYAGGTTSGPTGATLIYDFGESAYTATDGYWLTETCSATPLPKDEIIWVAVKTSDTNFGILYGSNDAQHGNFFQAEGRWSATGLSYDATVAYPSTFPSGGSFGSSWYAFEAILETRADIEFAASIEASTTESNPNLAGVPVEFDVAVTASSSLSKAILGDPLTITNPDAETGDGTGWTKDHGSGTVPYAETGQGGFGSYAFAVSSNDVTAGYFQDINIPAGWVDLVDKGISTATLSAALWGYADYNDYTRLVIEAYSSTTTVDETTYLTRLHDVPVWSLRPEWAAGVDFCRVQMVLPVGTRLLRIQVEGLRTGGTVLNGYADEFKLQLGFDRQRHDIPITNPGIDPSDTTGWTTDNFGVRSTSNVNVPNPSGDFFHSGTSVASAYMYQTIDVPSYLNTFIDNHGQGGPTRYEETEPDGTEKIIFHFDAILGSWSTSDKLKINITFLTEDSVSLGTLSSSDKAFSEYWEHLNLSVVPPRNTRKIRIRFDGTRVLGDNNDGYVAGLSAYFTTSISTFSSSISATTSTTSATIDIPYRNYGWEIEWADTSSSGGSDKAPDQAFSYPITGCEYYQSGWTSSPFTIDVKLAEAYVIEAYSIMAYLDDVPPEFTLYGSNTGAFGGEEATLDTQTGLSWSNDEKKLFTFSNSTAYQYFRIAFVPAGYNYYKIQEIQLLSTDFRQGDRRYGFNTDVASGGTATASQTQTGYDPEFAIDGDFNTSWWAGYNTSMPKWWQVQLSEAKEVERIAIRSAVWSYAPEDFEILGSNTGAFGGEETTLWARTDWVSQPWGANAIRHIPLTTTGSFTYYRINIFDSAGSYYSIGDVWLLEGTSIALEMAGTLSAASSTSAITLDRNYVFSSTISAASSTTDAGIEILAAFDSSITTSTSTSSIETNITRSITSSISPTSSTSDVQTSVLRELTGAFSAQSSSADIFLNPGRFFDSTVTTSSSTTAAGLNVIRSLAQEIAAASSTTSAALDPGVTFDSSIAASSSTSAIDALTVDSELASAIAAALTTKDITLFTEKAVDDVTLMWPTIHAQSVTSSPTLVTAGDVDFVTTIAASSQTSSAHLATQLDLTTSIAAASSTSSSELGTLRALAVAATAVSQSSNVALVVERQVTSSASAGSTTADAGLAIARDVSTSIEAASVTSQASLSTDINLATSLAASSSTSTAALNVLRELNISIAAESSVSSPSITVFTEDPTDDEIIATARNYRVVIPAAAMSGTGNQIRVLFRAHSAQDTVITGSAFGQRSGSTVDYVTGDPVRLTFNDGNNGYTIPGGTEYWSDWIDFDLDSGVDHLVHVFINASPHYYKTKDQAGPTYVRSGAFDDTIVTDVPDVEYSLDSKHYHVVSIEARTLSDIGVTRELTLSAAAASLTNDIRLGEDIVFAAAASASSATNNITLGVELPIAGVISTTTSTSDIDLYYPLSTSIAAASVAADISVLLSVDIDFASAVSGSTATSNVNLDRHYEFGSTISAGTATSSAELGIVTEYQLSTAVSAATQTSTSAFSLEMALAVTVDASSVTGDITVTIYTEYQLSTTISAASTTSDADLWLSYILDFASTFDANSATFDISLDVERPVSCAINSASSTQNIALVIDRVLSTVLSITTETSDASYDFERALSPSIAAESVVGDINMLLYAPFYTTIAASSQTEPITLMLGLLPLVIDLRIFSETADRVWESATPERIYVSATAVRTYESQTPVLEIENRTGTEVYSIPYEAKPYPFSS